MIDSPSDQHLTFQLMDELEVGIIIIDQDACFIFLNNWMEKASGLSVNSLCGQPLEQVFPELAGSRLVAAVDNAIGRRQSALLSSKLNKRLLPLSSALKPDGVMDQRIFIKPLNLDEGKSGCLIQVEDVSSAIERDKLLKSRNDQLRSVFKNAASGMISIDELGNITMFNPAAEKLFGYPENEVLAKNVSLLIPEPDRSRHDGYLAAYRNTGNAKIIGTEREVEGQRRDGSKFPMTLGVSKDIIGERQQFTGVITDLSERKRAEEALRRSHNQLEIRVAERTRELLEAKERAEISDHSKSEFLANMSHELRTPLNAIIGFSQMIQMEILGPVTKERYGNYVDKICASGEHLLGIISQILDISRVESGDLEPDEEAIDIQKALAFCASELEPQLSEFGATLSVTVEDGLPKLFADRVRFDQIIINLLSNSTKYNRPGGQVGLRASLDDQGRMVFVVEDTGIGIREEDIARIQGRFEQVQSSMVRGREGIGLGIPIIRLLADLHQAEFVLESIFV